MATPLESLEDKLKNHSANIGIVGMGYVGLPLAIRYAEVGFKTFGFDIDKTKVSQLNGGKSYIRHIADDDIERIIQRGFVATHDFSKTADMDALIICVPTPLNKHREPDLSYVIDTMQSLAKHLRKSQVISLESTTYPGTTEEELLPRIEATGLKVGEDVFLVYSPEREDPANENYTTQTIPKVCGGTTSACLEAGIALYAQVVDRVVPVSSTRAAEMTKLLENIHRAVNIGLVNEMKMVADKMDINIHEVIDAAATKPFGFVPYQPGPGLGGHCIPIDPFYLTWKAKEYGVDTKFIELAGEVNRGMPEWVVGKIAEGLNQQKKPVKGSRILILGIAYKKNVDDMRESPAVVIMDILTKKGAKVEYSDPHIPVFPKIRNYDFDLVSVDLTPESVASYDGVVLVTDHDAFGYEMIGANASMMIDTRGVFANKPANIIHS